MRIFLAPVVVAAVLLASVGPAAAQAPPAPTLSAARVQAAGDYFTDTFADPIDYANPADQLLVPGATQQTTARMESGQLRWERTATMDVAVVFAGYAPAAFAVGREGLAAPVDAARYTAASFRLYSATRTVAALGWDRCGPDVGRCGGGTANVTVEPGWHTYDVPLVAASGEPWTGSVVELRLTLAGDGQPTPNALDWFRLHAPGPDVAVSYPAGTLYWDADADRGNNTADNPGWGILGTGGGTARFPAAAHPDGTYRFYADDGPASEPLVIAAPVPVFAEPDLAGGADYAATVRGDAWDFSSPGDVAQIGNATEVRFEGGVLSATNAGPARGDPFLRLAMGPVPIDTARFHRMTVRTTLAGPFDLGFDPGGGSHGRLLWEYAADPEPRPIYDGKGVVVYPGVEEYTFDLALPPPLDAAEPGVAGHPGWAGGLSGLRYDPNEDPGPRTWTIDEIALRADDETADDAFELVWHDAGQESAAPATVSLYADTDRTGFDGRLIASGLPHSPGENRYRWDTRDWPGGRHHVYAVIEREGTAGRRYAGGPVAVGARVAGGDRIATAVALSKAAFPGAAPAAVLASGGDFPDALAAAPLAAAAGGPVLLNGRDALAPEVAAELDRLGAGTVYLMGGPAAQSPAVEEALAARPGMTVVRVAGENRYATAAAAARAAVARWRESGEAEAGARALVASGRDFPDALAAAPLAAALRAPLLLTDPDTVPAETAATLDALDVAEVTVAGGPAAVGDAAAARLGEGRAVRRLGGASRFATAVLLADSAAAAGADPAQVVVAAGRHFPDALAAGPAAAARGGVLLLAERDGVPAETAEALRARAPSLTWLRVAGGPAALTDPAVASLLRAAGR